MNADTSRNSLFELASLVLSPMSKNDKAPVNTDDNALAETLKDRVNSCRRIIERNDDLQPLAVQAEAVLAKSAQLLDAERSNRSENLVLAITRNLSADVRKVND